MPVSVEITGPEVSEAFILIAQIGVEDRLLRLSAGIPVARVEADDLFLSVALEQDDLTVDLLDQPVPAG